MTIANGRYAIAFAPMKILVLMKDLYLKQTISSNQSITQVIKCSTHPIKEVTVADNYPIITDCLL